MADLSWLKNIAKGGAGAVNSLFWGLPEAIGRKLAPEAAERFAADPVYRQAKTAGQLGAMLIPGNVPAWIAGAQNPDVRGFAGNVMNQNFLGVPKAALKKISPELAEKVVPDTGWGKAGAITGMIGSALVPTGSAAKGALSLAKAGQFGAGAAKAAGGVAKTLEAINSLKAMQAAPRWLQAALKGAAGAGLEGLAQSGIRSAAAGNDAAGVAREALAGGGLGALGGAAAGALTGGIKGLASKLKEGSELAYIAPTGVKRRDLMAAAKMQAGPGAGPMGIRKVVDKLRGDVVDLIKSEHLLRQDAIENMVESDSPIWKALHEGQEKLVGKRKGADIVNQFLNADDLVALGERHGDQAAVDALDELKRRVGDVSGGFNIRDMLDDAYQFSRTKGQTTADKAMGEIAKLVKGRFDDAVGEAAEKAGQVFPGADPTYKGFKHRYGVALPLIKGDIAQDLTPKKWNIGSMTQPRLAAQALMEMASGGLGGIGLGGYQAATTPGDFKRKAEAGLGGLLFGSLGGALAGAAGTRAMGAGVNVARALERAAPAIEKAGPAVASTVGRLAANIARGEGSEPVEPVAAVEPPKTEGQAQAVETGAAAAQAEAVPEAGDKYRQLIRDKFDSAWAASGMESYYPGMADVMFAQVEKLTDGLAPEKTAQIIYPDPEERKRYLQALSASRALSANLDQATAGRQGVLERIMGSDAPSALGKISEGLQPGEDQTAQEGAYQSILGTMRDIASERKIPEKEMRATVDRILKSKKPAAEKRKEIDALLKQYGVALDLMERAGVTA